MTSAEFVERVDRYWTGMVVAPGPSFGCRDCGLEDVRQDDADANARHDAASEPFFSWHACESCGSRLGGDRHAVHYWDKAGEGFSGHANVCTDCFMYLANGDVPEGE